ncbi:MAG: recombinase family protein [Clostridia bacterium]|nr:recombinase family protein [Clostridia bacterium]
MSKAVIYARYSSDSQTEQSIEGQLRVCKEYSEKNGLVIINEYIDRAMTGTNDKRPALQQILYDSKDKSFNFVIVYKLDRFSRNRYDSAVSRAILVKNGVKLLSATENISDAPEGILLDSVLVGLAEYYSVELSQKVKHGLKESRIKGQFTGGRTPYGYNVENLKIIINEIQANIVRLMFNEYLSNKKLKILF